MHPLTRAAALASAFVGVLFVACSSPYAPADSPDGGDGDAATDPEASGPDGAAGADVFVPIADAAENDASTDANDAAPACVAPKEPNGAVCAASADCCSGACASNHACRDQCKLIGDACTILGTDCCIGTYCSTNMLGKCVVCRANGAAAEVAIGNMVVLASCCSGHADASTKKCTP